jgi:hypothetical protein
MLPWSRLSVRESNAVGVVDILVQYFHRGASTPSQCSVSVAFMVPRRNDAAFAAQYMVAPEWEPLSVTEAPESPLEPLRAERLTLYGSKPK